MNEFEYVDDLVLKPTKTPPVEYNERRVTAANIPISPEMKPFYDKETFSYAFMFVRGDANMSP
jgi:hypothetical protein